MNRRDFISVGSLALIASAVPGLALAERYPSRSVKVIVPYAAGGPADILARLASQKLTDLLGQSFYVENVGGAGGNIGMGQGARSTPDGYTLLVVPPNVVVNPLMYPSVPYDPYKDFTPVTVAFTSKVVLAVHPSLPAKNVKDLVALVKANPKTYTFASPGIGTPPHLVGEAFRVSLGIELPHVPFNSAGLAVQSALAGHTPIAFTSLPPAVDQIKAGNLRALAVTSTTRSDALQDVPTMKEAGFSEIDGEGWFAFMVPAGTPREIVSVLHTSIIHALQQPELKSKTSSIGFEPIGNSPAEAADMFRSEGTRWAEVIRKGGLKASN